MIACLSGEEIIVLLNASVLVDENMGKGYNHR
jgi:hypothetical protein